jgi:sugar/nucleoside kinase (ribokinase family)
MQNIAPIDPVDYLVIGHVTQDLTPQGPKLGGTVSYAALTAKALGLRVGIVTACAPDTDLSLLKGIQIMPFSTEKTTTFENIYTPNGRIQFIHHQAPVLNLSMVPESWRSAPIIHLGPVAREIDPNLARSFPDSFVGLTPQGWMREWDSQGRVRFGQWPEAAYVLEKASAAVLSIEDIAGDESYVEEISSHVRILAVTEGANGVRIFWNGDVRRFRPPHVEEVDPVGAGDIFATVFFIRLQTTRDPWEAARCANFLASRSVTRKGLEGIPTLDEVHDCMFEVIKE